MIINLQRVHLRSDEHALHHVEQFMQSIGGNIVQYLAALETDDPRQLDSPVILFHGLKRERNGELYYLLLNYEPFDN